MLMSSFDVMRMNIVMSKFTHESNNWIIRLFALKEIQAKDFEDRLSTRSF